MKNRIVVALVLFLITPLAMAEGPPTVDVNITNQPIEVLSVNEETPTPLQSLGYDGFITAFAIPHVDFGPVPAGKRWIIEHISAGVGIDVGSTYRCEVQVRDESDELNKVKMIHHLHVSELDTQNAIHMVVSTPIKLIAETGQTVRFECTITQPQGVGSRSLEVGITGAEVSISN